MQKNKSVLRTTAFLLSLIGFIGTLIVVGILLLKNPAVTELNGRPIGSYRLMLLQCAAGSVALFLPRFLEQKLSVSIPPKLCTIFYSFLFCAIFLGEVFDYYYGFKYFDSCLHFISGIMLAGIGFSLPNFVEENPLSPKKLDPIVYALIAFFFAMTLGIIWECYEYTMDGLLDMNMQKFLLEDGTPLVGRAALQDTMQDILISSLAVIIVSIYGCRSLQRDDGKIAQLSIRPIEPPQSDTAIDPDRTPKRIARFLKRRRRSVKSPKLR